MVVRSPAKLNLHLTCGPLRPDGYHELTTVFQAVSLYDELSVTRAGQLQLTLTGEGAGELPVDDRNLAVRAVRLLAEATGCDPAVSLALCTAIPVAGGCAGGSADAAAALVACDALWGTGLPREELAALALQLGSDVPFALHGGTALARGRGEQLTTVLGEATSTWVLAIADGGLSTPAVYDELDRRRATGPVQVAGDPGELLQALRRGDPAAVGRALANDLQPAALALRPALRRVLDAGLELGALGGVVTGSGPTVALLARGPEQAGALSAALAAEGVCRTVRVAEGPVAGARVVG